MIRPLSNEPVNGRWLLTGIAGRGSTAVVYRAFDLVAEEVVAIKAMPGRGGSRGPGGRARREFLDLARLRHRNLVETYELATAERGPLPKGTPFFTMELLDRASLPLPDSEPRRVASLALGLLAGLECVHAHGLVHRDVKPSNVLLDGRRAGPARVKLSDLGLATRGVSEGGGLRGTLQYAAPETIAGGRIDGRSDLYSLGVLLFEAATGALPFDGADPTAALDWHFAGRRLEADLAKPSSPTLSRVVGRLLAHRPGERFASAREAWEEIADAYGEDAEEVGFEEETGDGPLIGRNAEWTEIVRWLRAASRTGGLLRISGPPGSGLSRLCREAGLRGRGEGWSVHVSRCREGETPFSPFCRPLREILLSRCGSGAALRTEILTLLGGPSLWGAGGHALAEAVGPLAGSLASFLLTNRSRHPLLLVLDDFDRADESVRSVVREISARAPACAARILILTSMHQENPDDPRCFERRPSPDGTARKALRGRGATTHRPGSAARAETSRGMGAGSRAEGVPCGALDQGPWQEATLKLGPISFDESRILLEGLPGVGSLGPAESEVVVRASQGMPGRLVRLARSRAGRQRHLFPPLREPRVSA